jgi:hypothetical protein
VLPVDDLVGHTAGFNLGLLMRQLMDVGTPRGLQGRRIAVAVGLLSFVRWLGHIVIGHSRSGRPASLLTLRFGATPAVLHGRAQEAAFTTGC